MSTQNEKKTSKEASLTAKQIRSLIRNSLNFSLMRFFVLSFGWILVNGCTIGTSESTGKGVTQTTITLGSVLALEGQEEALGNNMKSGLEAALDGQIVKGKKINIKFENDYYEPSVAKQKTEELINSTSGILLMIGNVGTPTAKQTLPILRKNQVPAVGFLTGAQRLRENSEPSELITNYRASYSQEIEKVVKMALEKKDIKASEICAYVQSDSYGMSGLKGLKDSLNQERGAEEIVRFYNKYLDNQDLNNKDLDPQEKEQKGNQIVGPVGFYTRNTPHAESGYKSLKKWEKKRGINCKLVVTAGTYSNIARFIKLAQEKGNDWLISSLSFTDAQQLILVLEEYGIKHKDKVIVTQVVPLLKSDLDIVKKAESKFKEQGKSKFKKQAESKFKKQAESKFKKQAESKFKDEFNNIFLEGYIIGKMTLKILQDIPGEINRKNFLEQVAVSKFDLDGVCIDLTNKRTQASHLVLITELTPKGFKQLDDSSLAQHDNCENNPL